MLNGKNNTKITNKNDSKLSAGTTLFAECQVGSFGYTLIHAKDYLDYDNKNIEKENLIYEDNEWKILYKN